MVKATSSSEKAEVKSSSSASPTSESSKYKGVRKRKWGKWVSEIRLPNSRERIWLGSYDSPEKAARAFDAALFCLRGHTAKFNFPESPPEIAGGMSLSPSEIQLAAAKFANSASSETLPAPPSENLQAESPCGSSVESDGTVPLGGNCRELKILGEPFLYSLTNMGSGNFATDYGIFPGFDELNNGFFAPPPDQFPVGVADYYGEEGDLAQDSFLWSF